MIDFLADENFKRKVVSGLIRRSPGVNVLLAQEVGLTGLGDDAVLAWAADQRRVVITHDNGTMPHYAYTRLRRGEPMSGLFVIGGGVPVGRAVEELLLITECSDTDEWEGRVAYLPL